MKLNINLFGGRGASSSASNRVSVAEIPQSTIRRIKSQKALRELAEEGKATDITRYSDEQSRALREKHGGLEKVQIVSGTYGMNGALLRSYETGEYFVITSRNSNLFYWV